MRRAARVVQSFNISLTVAMALYAAVSSGSFPEGSLPEPERAELLARWLMRDVKAARLILKQKMGIEFADL